MKISLAIIAKNNEEILGRLLDSVAGVFDEIVVVDTGSTDKTVKVAEKYGAKVSYFKWCDDFSAARQFSFNQCTNEWVMWLDTDDVVEDAHKIKAVLNKVKKDPTIHSVGFPYYYAWDKDGNCTTILWRERLVKKSEFKWKGRVHETLVELKRGSNYRSEDVKVNHYPEKEETKKASERNLNLLKLELKEQGDDPDPRTVFYIGNTLFGMEKWKEALMAYQKYVGMSGWEEELYHAYIRIAVIQRHRNDYESALDAAYKAFLLFPHYPDAYIHLGWIFQDMKEYERSNWFLKLSLKREVPKWTTAYNPRDYDSNTYKLIANNYVAMEKFDQCLGIYNKLSEMNPTDENLQGIIKELMTMKAERDEVKGYVEKVKKIKNDKRAVRELYNTIPDNIKHYPSIIKVREIFQLKRNSSGKDVCIFCPGGWEEWTPDSVEGGIGGSEEAAINVARELTKKGYKVTVYNSITEERDYDGVMYKPFWAFNRRDKWDFFISWRHEEIFDYEINATKKYLWLHDVPNPYEFTKKRLEQIDKIIVLSVFHRLFLEGVPNDKFYITSNGVDTTLFDQEVERNSYKMVYTSSYDRGLENILVIWPEIKKKVPEAELHIYYGWGNFEKRYKNNVEKKNWKQMMDKLMKQDGVFEHGRVGHKEIAKEMLSAGIWAYPCDFEEINCISGLKAQIAGAIPVVNDYAALRETVKFGAKIDVNIASKTGRNQYANVIIDVLLNQKEYEADRKKMMEEIRKEYSWENITNNWSKDLL